jgi:hypothetical protein
MQNRVEAQSPSSVLGVLDTETKVPSGDREPRQKRRLRAMSVFALSGLVVGGLLVVPAIVRAPEIAEVAMEDCNYGDVFCYAGTYNARAFDMTANVRFISDFLSGDL